MKNLFSTCFLYLFVPTLFAQNIEFDKANFPNRKTELNEAIKNLDLGTDLYTQGRKEFEEQRKLYISAHKYLPMSLHDFQRAGSQYFKSALAPLNAAYQFNPQHAPLNYMLGFICLFQDPADVKALEHLEKAEKLAVAIDPDVRYWLAWAYQLQTRWNEAIDMYESYKKNLAPRFKNNTQVHDDIAKKIEECRNGKMLSAKPERVFVDNLGPAINSSYPEYAPSISTDEEKIFFTSRRPGSVGGRKDLSDAGYFEDIYSAGKVGGKWQNAKQLSKSVNTEDHDAVAGLSPDGSKLFIYRFGTADGGDVYESVLFGTDWEVPNRLNRHINTRYHESSVSLSFDGKRLFFVSRKETGFGDADIYYSDLDVNGDWGPSRNIGPDINTKYPEEGAFMHPDGVTLYFSSKGHNSMGGYDIFKSEFRNGKWQPPVNLGYPINGPDDDVFFVVSGSGNRAYFASSKAGGLGDQDIYKITFLGPEKPPLANTVDQLISVRAQGVVNPILQEEIESRLARLTILKGTISDEKTESPLDASIDLFDNEKNQLLATFRSNTSTGKYLVTLPSGKNYGLAVKSEGYLFHSENFLLPPAAEFQEFVLDIAMKKMEVGKVVVLRNIFFDVDKATLRPESEAELERLSKLLKENPSLRIEIGSHTDNTGTDEYNLHLSENRSAAVVKSLESKGVSASRLVSKGYGESMPVDGNDSEKGRQNNRRTEFKILSK